MKSCSILLTILFVGIQLVGLALIVSGVVTPIWMDPEGGNRIVLIQDNKTEIVTHSGLWQLCYDGVLNVTLDENQRIDLDELRDSEALGKAFQGAYTSMEDCTQEGLEQFYKSSKIWGEDVWTRVNIVRAASILSVVFGFIKVFAIIFDQNSAKNKGWTAWITGIIAAILELAVGAVAIALWSSMLVSAADEADLSRREYGGKVYDEFTDYSGASYWIFAVGVGVNIIPNIAFCV